MYQYLNTQFTEEETIIIHKYCNNYETELSVLYGVNMGLFGDEGINPNRMILVGGYYLLEEREEEGEWYLGQFSNNKYVFWSQYESLEKALNSL